MIEYDPYSEEMMDDPFPTYVRLRNESPAHYVEKYDCWAISRFADIVKVGMDGKNFTMTGGSTAGHLMGGGLEVDTSIFMSMDPPGHTPRRALVSSLFKMRRIKDMEPLFREIVATHVDSALDQGKLNTVTDMAGPVADHILCMLIGLPPEDGGMLRTWVHVFERFFHHRPDSDEDIAVRNEAAGNLLRYLIAQVRHRRQHPTKDEDVLNAFIGANIDGESMSDPEISVNLMSVLIGGVDTVPKHFGSLTYWLARHPEQRAACAADPSLLPQAVNEALRYDAPTHILGRRALVDSEWHGETIREGQGVLLLYASGNRDEREFEDPDRFDISRTTQRIVTFGYGIHLCIGMHTARMESRLMLERLLARSPEYEVDWAGVEKCKTAGLHGFSSVPITVT